MPPNLDPQAYNLARAIKRAETGNSSNAYQTRGASGEYGAYQFTKPFWDTHAPKYLGANAQPSIENQNKLAYSVIKEWKDQGMSPAQIASRWNSGRPDAYRTQGAGVNQYGVQHNVQDYTKKVSNYYRELAGNQQTQSVQQPQTFGQAVKDPNTLNPYKGVPVLNQAAQFGLGAASTVGSGFGNLMTGIAKGVRNRANVFTPGSGEKLTPVINAMQQGAEQTKQMPEAKGVFGTLGKAFGMFGGYGMGNAPIAGAQRVLGSAAARGVSALNAPGVIAKPLGFLGKQVARVAPEVAGNYGMEYAFSGGDKEKAKQAGIAGGVLSGGLGVLGDVGRAVTRRPEIQTSVARALGVTGKRTPTNVRNQVPQMVEGLATIGKYADNIEENGVLRRFDPINAEDPFDETIKGLVSAKNKVFKAYDELARTTGDMGQGVSRSELEQSLNKYITGITTEPQKRRAMRLLRELRTNFPGENITPYQLQEYIQKLNQELGGVTGGAERGAIQVTSDFTTKAREVLDNLITRATGSEYQTLRNEYAAMKSVEDRLVKQYQRALSKKPGLGAYAELLGSSEALSAILAANPALLAKGIILRTGARALKGIGDPARNLRNVFKSLEDGSKLQKPVSDIEQRIGIKRIQQNIPKMERSVRPVSRQPLPPSLQLGSGATPMPPRTIKSSVKTVPAQKNPLSVNPKTGKFQTSYSSTIAAPETKKPSLLKRLKDKRGFMSTPYIEKGNLTTKILKDLEGKTTVSKQYILDATNRGELKQTERDIIRQALEGEGATVNVSDFAKKVKAELLPLKPKFGQGYEGTVLPDELRGDIKNYGTITWESPINTVAGKKHSGLGNSDNYYSHSRFEELPDDKTVRIIEEQSDLYQKGGVEKERALYQDPTDYLPKNKKTEYNRIDKRLMDLNFAENKSDYIPEIKELEQKKFALQDEAMKLREKSKIAREKEIKPLQQYDNDKNPWWKRNIKENIRLWASKGKTKLQFPTGETAMKIEGLGENSSFFVRNPNSPENYDFDVALTPEKLKVGIEVENGGQKMIITDVLGDGKFKAVPKNVYDAAVRDSGISDFKKASESMEKKGYNVFSRVEEFDISGKVDTSNPIYKFYEKDVQKYLNKYGGKRIVDAQGVSWIEIPIKKEYAKQPVEAFGKLRLGALPALTAGTTGAGLAINAIIKKKEKKSLGKIPPKLTKRK